MTEASNILHPNLSKEDVKCVSEIAAVHLSDCVRV